jgi:hypothetical protein
VKYLFLIFTLIYFTCFYSQSFDIPAAEYPVSSIVELKGFGALMLGKDPTGVSNKVNLALVSKLKTTVWNQSITPKGKEFFFISGDNTQYSYLMDNIELIEGKYFFNQVNASGTIKTSSSILTHILTKIFKDISEFDFNEMKIVDIISTENALVHVFRYHNKKEKKYTELAFFMTHGNLITYASFLGDTKEGLLTNGFSDHWKFIGSTNDNIYFATRGIQTQKKGWAVKSFTSRGAVSSSTFIFDSPETFEPIENIPFGATGRYYLKHKPLVESNVLTQINGKFYLTGIVLKNGLRELKSYELINEKWELLSSFSLVAAAKGKNNTQIGILPITEGLGVKVVQTVASTVVFMPFDKSKNIILSLFNEKMNFNPTRMILSEKKQEFGLNLQDRKLFFAYNQLNKPGIVKFEYILK